LPTAHCLEKNAPERRWASLGGWALGPQALSTALHGVARLPLGGIRPDQRRVCRSFARLSASRCLKTEEAPREAPTVAVRPRSSVALKADSGGHPRRARSVSPRRGTGLLPLANHCAQPPPAFASASSIVWSERGDRRRTPSFVRESARRSVGPVLVRSLIHQLQPMECPQLRHL
jgi:hypothetical protein